MSRYPSYPRVPFSSTQNFLARDPNGSGGVVRVQGQDILNAAVQSLTNSGATVFSHDLLTEAATQDYSTGVYVIVGGGTALFDGQQNIYRVSNFGSGGTVMTNGNELVLLLNNLNSDWYTDTGFENNVVLSPTPGNSVPISYTDLISVYFFPAVNSTGSVLVDLAGLGTKGLFNPDGSDAILRVNQPIGAVYVLSLDQFIVFVPTITRATEIPGFINSTSYFIDENGDSQGNNFLNALPVLPVDTWRTIGPTGSGAIIEWSALDALPPDCTFVDVFFDIGIGNTSERADLTIYSKRMGSAATEDGTQSATTMISAATAAGPIILSGDGNTKKIPLEDNSFELRWDSTNGAPDSIRLYLVGFGLNEGLLSGSSSISVFEWYNASGINNIALTTLPGNVPPPSYDGLIPVNFLAENDSTGPIDISLPGLGFRNAFNPDGSDPQFISGHPVNGVYDSSIDEYIIYIPVVSSGGTPVPPVVPGFTGSVFSYIDSIGDGQSGNSFDVLSNIGGVFQSIGPSFSGADNIWTALDNIPLTATSLKIRINFNINGFSPFTVSVGVTVSARITGSAAATVDTVVYENVIRNIENSPLAIINNSGAGWFEVPIDNTNSFDLRQVQPEAIGLGSNIDIYIAGFYTT